MIYGMVSDIYDRINAEIDYKSWADFFEKCFEKYCANGEKPALVLDLGSGTGKMTLELARRGYDMTGIDISPEMLSVAREYAEDEGYGDKILWLMQDMRDFELYGTVDAVISTLDCINHLTSVSDLKKTLSLVHNYLIPDGIFIFDINGRGKFERVYSDNAYVNESENGFLVWQNFYRKRDGICDFYLTLFKENPDGTYTRQDEMQREKMYTVRSIKSALEISGFEFIGAFNNFDFSLASDDDERIYIVAKCKK